MKTALSLFALAFLTLSAGVLAEPERQAPLPAVQAPPAAAAPVTAAPDHTADAALAKLFAGQKPVNRTTSCYDARFQYCLDFCSGVAAENGCDLFASQQCLCEHWPADCPVCY
ncbi:MAG TPA: hypothetical protein VLX28_26250 [Thermoanaerobaculia bacterium]|nr:hypothetical protein [Thermoanaerobaculia bacterium]